MQGFQKLAQAGGGGRNPPQLLTSLPLSKLNQILCEQIQFYEKSLCKISSVLVKKLRHNDAINFSSLQYMVMLTFCHCDVKMTSYIKFFMNLNLLPKYIALSAKFEVDQVIILKLIQLSLFFNPKNDVTD